MTTEAAVGGHRALEVDARAWGQRAEAAAIQCLGHDVDGEARLVVLGDGQADAVDGDRRAMDRVRDHQRALDAQDGRLRAVLDGTDVAEFFDDSGEHVMSPSRRSAGWAGP